MPTNESCPTSDNAYPRSYEGEMNFEITRNGAVVRTFSSQSLGGGWTGIAAYKGTESIEFLYKESVEKEGVYNFVYDFNDAQRSAYFNNNTRFLLKGDLEVTSTQNGDRQDIKFSMMFLDGAREFKLEGEGHLVYKFP